MVLYFFHLTIGCILLISNTLMFLKYKTERKINFYLISIFTLLCLHLIFNGLVELFDLALFAQFNFYQLILILTPVTYLFIQKLIANIKSPERKDFWHFLVPILLVCFVGRNYSFKWYSYTQFAFFGTYLSFYIKLIISLIRIHVLKPNSENSISKIVINWVSNILKLLIVVYFLFLTILFIETFKTGTDFIKIKEYLIPVVILIGFVKVVFIVNFEFVNFNFTDDNAVSNTYENKLKSVWNSYAIRDISDKKDVNLNEHIQHNLNEYIYSIEKLALINFAFRDKYYSIKEMSKELGLPKYHIVYLFKYHCDIKFNEYIRQARVYDAIGLIQNGYLKNNTLNSLAEFVGFSSYNPFLLSFKQVTGLSPYEYNRKVKVVSNTH